MHEEKDIIRRIEEEVPNMTTSQLKIANCILSDPMVILFSSIEQAAGQMDVSTATVVRFANRFGYHGYTELQATIRAYFQQRLEPVGRLNESVDTLESSGSGFRQFYLQQMKFIENFYTPELEERLEQAVTLLETARHIYTAGSRGSYAIAYYLGHHLNRIFHNCDILQENERLSDSLLRIQPDDVMLVVNQPRYARRLYNAAQAAKEAGAKLVVLSDSLLSPYCKIADVFFSVPNKSCDFHNSLLAAMMIAEMLISAMTIRNRETTQESLSQMEPLFEKLETFL